MKKRVPNSHFFEPVCRLVTDGEPVKIRVKGASMRPFLRDEVDEVILERVDVQQVRQGDILLAKMPQRGRYVLHRLIERKGQVIRLMGDGNLGRGETCRLDDVCALVRYRIRNGRRVDLSSPRYRRYALYWFALTPLRRPLLWGLKHLGI
jgi:hypothetical protein